MMGCFASISAAIRTADQRFSGTGARPSLVVNQGGVDRLNQPLLTHTTVGELKRAQSIYCLHSLRDLPQTEVIDDLVGPDDLYVRLATNSTDLWRPELVMVWGWSRECKTVPLALDMNFRHALSLDPKKGVSSVPVRRVEAGGSEMPIERLLLVVVTYAAPYAGTDDPIWLRVTTADGPVTHHLITDTPQADLEINSANIYEVPVIRPFNRKEVEGGAGEIRLGISGSDKWVPRIVMLFGLEGAAGDPDRVVSLARVCDPGPLSTDPREGVPSLPLTVE
jgi:hypothetical protein